MTHPNSSRVGQAPRRWRQAVGGLALAMALGGCDGLLDLPDGGLNQPPPDMLIVNDWVAGQWEIIGRGQFDVCASPFSEVEFDLRSATFTVEQDARGVLTVPRPPVLADGEFRFEDGRIIGSEVRFVTVEEGASGAIRLAYTGVVDALNNVRGRFEGIGPDACLSVGEFTARIDLAPLPPPPDMGPPDMSAADAGAADAATDGEAPDGAPPDGAPPDGAPPDGGALDGGAVDAETPTVDGSAPDAG